VLSLSKAPRKTESAQARGISGAVSSGKDKPREGDVIRMELVGANPKTRVEGADPLPGKANYFIGNDPAKWHTGVLTYAKVRYASVYPGIDLVYYGNQRQLEYDLVVAPGANTGKVRLRFEGAKRLALTPSGDLEVIGQNGRIMFHAPVAYQLVDGRRRDVRGGFTLLHDDQVQFSVAKYNREQVLVIDPVLTYSTYFGDFSSSNTIAVDAQGNAYIAGSAGSSNFPSITGSYNTGQNSCCAFVTKFNPSGSSLVYAAFFGGTSFPYIYNDPDTVTAIAIDSSGEVYATGFAYSTNFPVTNGAFQTINNAQTKNNSNAFVVKINTSGSALLYSTYLGGSTSSSGNAIAIDGSGNAYIAGGTLDSDFPITSGSFQTVNLAYANSLVTGFVAKLGATGTSLGYATYLGGSNLNLPSGIAVDGTGNAYITGNTISTDFPITPGAFQTTDYPPQNVNGGVTRISTTVFVTKLNPSGTNEVYSTYLGGNGGAFGISSDKANAIAVDSSGNAYIAGSTQSTDFPITAGAFQTSLPSTNIQGCAFVSKLNANGSGLTYSTYLAGGYQDVANGIAVDSLGNAYAVGGTYSQDFPVTPGAFQVNANALSSEDGFVSEISSSGTQLIYSTFLGGTGLDYAGKVALDSTGNVYVTGESASTDFPVTSSAYLQTWGGSGFTGFLTKLALSSNTSPQKTATPSFNPLGGQFSAAQSITLLDATPGAVFYYTTDGSAPTKSSTRYQNPIPITKTATINAFAAANGYANSDIATATITIGTSTKTAPTVSVTPSSSTVSTGQNVQVTVNVSGSGAIPTGSIVLTSYEYTSSSAVLANGSATVSIPGGSLAVGIDSITATYTPDSASSSTYTSSTGSATITVTQSASTPTVNVTPAATSITTMQSLSVSVAVSGGAGKPTPTGVVTLTSGNYTSAGTALSSGGATITIPVGSLATGIDTVAATYTPDSSSSSTYTSSTGAATVTVSAPAPPGFAIAGTSVTLTAGASKNDTSTITVTPANGFTGSVALTAAITSGPGGAADPPTLSFGSTSPASIMGASAGSATLTISTTANTSAAFSYPASQGTPWYTFGSAAFACVLWFGFVPRRWAWRRLPGLVLLLVAAGSAVVACGTSGVSKKSSNSGTTPGSYTVTVTGTSGSLTSTGTISLTVQ
jgi:hypothetical protein